MNPKEEMMKKVGRTVSIYMAFAMSACLSIVGVVTGNIGNIMSGQAKPMQLVISILFSFVVSLIISLIIGFIVPIGKVSQSATKNMKEGPAKHCMESLISDLIYTPVITLAMTWFAYVSVMKRSQGMADLHFPTMFLGSLVICMIVGFILIYILMPIFLKKALKKAGVPQ